AAAGPHWVEAVPIEAPETSLAPEAIAQDVAAAPTEAAETGDAAANASAATDSGPAAGNITEVNGNGAGDEVVESVGGADAMEEEPERMYWPPRQDKIQDVIKTRQGILVQEVKEEPG